MTAILHIIDFLFRSIINKGDQGTNTFSSSLLVRMNVVLFVALVFIPQVSFSQAAASSNYDLQTGNTGTTYNWIDCSAGTSVISGDDIQASISWPFDFSFYGNTYTTSNSLSVCTNGFIRLDGAANTSYQAASDYTLSSSSTELGQIIALAVIDGNVSGTGWIKYLLSGTSPNRVFTIEYNDFEIDYNDNLYADVQVSFYETSNKVVLKLGDDNITTANVEMGLHSGITGYFNKWQEVKTGANNTWMEYTPSSAPIVAGPQASWNYSKQTGSTGSTYYWINCASGATLVSGDDAQAQINWPFDFTYYDNDYTTTDQLSVSTNGFIRLDGIASTEHTSATNYDLTSTDKSLGQIIALAAYDGNVDGTGWVKSIVSGSSPNQIFTIEYNDLEVDYNDAKYTDVQVSFYESTNKIVLKLGYQNIDKGGVDMGLHSGVDTYFDDWQEVSGGTNNTWVEYSPQFIEVNATIGTATAYYSNLKEAIDNINNGTHQGDVTIKVNHSTTEADAIELYASGTGSSSYSSINMYPTKTGLSITGNMGGPLFDLSGADNVSIDGRVNRTGSNVDLSIVNEYTGSTTATSAIRFINGATNNTIKYCTIKSSESKSTSGIILFSTSSSSSGNSNNIIEYNNITNATDAARPVNVIYSKGTSGKENSNNIIRHNNIYDFFKHASASRGVLVLDNSTAWTIKGNSFYETTDFVPTRTVTYEAIKVDNTSGGGFVITDNYIGGSAPLCGGDAWTKTNNNRNLFNGIYVEVGQTSTTSIQNNTIQNIDWSNSGNSNWKAIYVNEGNVDVGTETGNTIGDSEGINSIIVTGGTSGQFIYGVMINSSGVINCSNNTIGSITGSNLSAYATHIYGIYLTGSSTATLENNSIGSTITANSIFSSSASTDKAQNVYGIYSKNSGTTSIHENTIANLRNNTSCTTTGTRGLVFGIRFTSGINTVDENVIRDLSNANANTSSYLPSVAGVHFITTTQAQSVHDNLVYNLYNTNTSFSGNVVGIFTRNSSGADAGDISANFIHSLSVDAASTGAKIYGLYENTDGIVYANNIVTLAGNTDSQFYGIYDVGNSGKTVKFYFNSVYLSGTNTGSEKSYALRYNTNSNIRDLRNNILYNARSGGSGTHYGLYYDNTGGTYTVDNNNYFVSGTNSVIARYSSDKATLADLQTATGQDANSISINPEYATPGGTSSDDYITSATMNGVVGTGVTTDYDEISRSNPPKMGALELSESYVWQGNTSTDFATASNWKNGEVPTDGVDISFAASPANDCYLDQNRVVKDITNTSVKIFNLNGRTLTLTGDIVSPTANQIDASSSSLRLLFNGQEAQSIPSGVLVANTVGELEQANSHGLTLEDDIIILDSLILTDGPLVIGDNTLTINGAVSTDQGTLNADSTSNIIIGGNSASTTLSVETLNNFTLNRAAGINLGASLDVTGTLSLTEGTLTVGAHTLTVSGTSPTRVNGTIDASHSSATMVFANASSIACPGSIFSAHLNNLTIDGAGLSSCCSCTINGILNLASANPSSTMGLLHMGTDTLSMGVNATIIGDGDVSGIVLREHIFTTNTEYTFGSQYTTFSFVDENTKPTWICVKINLGVSPTWDSWAPNGKVKRYYQVSGSDNSSTSQASINMRYLNSELDDTYHEESKLVFWHQFTPYSSGEAHEHGKAVQNFTNHYIGVLGLTFGAASTTSLDDSQVGIAYSLATKNTWKGEVAGHETEWEQAQNWTAGNVPLSTDDILIPSDLSYYPSLTASSNAVAGTIEIDAGASITANSYDITIYGAGGAWINNGTFNAGTGKVLFNHGVINEVVTVSGVTNFYDIEVGANTTMQPVQGNVLRIAGAGSADMTSIIDFNSIDNTVEWNGTDQTIVNPNGIDGNSGYYKLILSGSGTKTMPTTAMSIIDEFKLDGTVSATAQAPLYIGVELEILENATFTTGAFEHTVGGPFDNRGSFVASAGSQITLDGTESQSIYGGVATTFEKLVINNAAGVDVYDNVTVNDVFTLSAGQFNVGATTLTLNGDVINPSGSINVTASSSLTFGGTSTLTLSNDLFSTIPIVDTLTIERTEGVVFANDITVNSQLNLLANNPSSGIIGSLDMGTSTLLMGADAITLGVGDVTGIVKRTTLLDNVEYTFGSPYTSVVFPSVGTLPTEMSVKISIGSAPSWDAGAVKRVYDIAQVGGSNTSATLKGHYLDSELNGNDENELIDFTYIYPLTTLIERGRSDYNSTENWVALNNTNFSDVPSSFGVMELGFGISSTNVITWDGSYDSDWDEPTNWTPAFMPSADKVVHIPDASTTPNDPLLPDTSTIYSLTIDSGAILNSGSNSKLVVLGATGAWFNQGTFNASTGLVSFNHGNASNIVTIGGTTDFYNLGLGENTIIQPVEGCYVGISGQASGNTGSVVDFSSINNTVEWKGDNQYIVNPTGIGGHGGYYNLILSGSGTKNMPSTAMNVSGSLSTSGTTTAIAADSLLITGNLNIGVGSIFGTGTSTHLLAGDFVNDGTFATSTSSNIIFNGTENQTIGGSSITDFNRLTTFNIAGLTLLSDINVDDTLDLADGDISVGNSTLGINGSINNPSGNIILDSNSSLSFGGTDALVLNDNLFNANPTIENLIINRAGGVTLGNEDIIVSDSLALTAGILTVGGNTLTITGSKITRSSGYVDVSNTAGTLVFENATAISLPESMFSAAINNLTINGAGGVSINEDVIISNSLSLLSANPSSTKGSLDFATDTLHMGTDAKTFGSGDVTGIIKREHTFSNDIDYSFGSQYTTLNFLNVLGSTKPTWIICKIEIGAAPTWRSEAINRFYSFAQSGGNDRMIVKLHYLDSELHGVETDEEELVFWDAYNPDLVTPNSFSHYFPRNHNGTNTNDNWVQLTGPAINYLATSSILDVKQWGLGYSNVSTHKWIGLGSPSYPGDWSLPGHWEGGVPQSEDPVLIPTVLPEGNSGYPYRNLLPVIAPASAKSIEIESGAILISDGSDITISGGGNAWVNNGVFIPDNGTVIFNRGDETEVAIISGTTDFYNLTIEDKTYIQANANAILRVAGMIDTHSGSGLDFTSNTNTVEYNGTSDQTVINPISASTTGYHNLIVSGGGSKTLEASSINILGSLSTNVTISATGNTLVLNGTSAQNISGSVVSILNNLTISNTTEAITASVDLSCSGNLINSGELDMTDYKLAVSGTLSNTGEVRTSSTDISPLPSGKTWSGTVEYYQASGEQNIMSGVYNNLLLSNTSGTQSATGNVTVNSALTTTSAGVFDMGIYQLSGSLSTISNGGSIYTQNTSSTPIPSGKTWGGTVAYDSSNGDQTVMTGTYNLLSIGNTSGTQNASGAIVTSTLNTTFGGTLNMGTYAISGITSVDNLGALRTQNASADPFTSGLTWGGTVLFDGSSSQTIPTGESIFNNLSISNTSGVSTSSNQTVNGILNLTVANPDGTHGSLDMGTNTLTMGANATTMGVGDVTGTITRTSFVVNTTYTYGNANQYVLFPEAEGQVLPTSFSLRVTLLATAPTWVDGASKRLYEIAQTGGANTKATFRTNYLDDELASGASESVLSYWQNVSPFGAGDVLERGWSDYNIEDNWITFSDADFGNIPSAMGYFKVAIAPTQVAYRTWNGSNSTTTWNTATNWTPQGIPSSSLGVVIPDVASSNSYSPDLPTDALGKYLIIQDGGILNTVSNAVITLSGSGNVWSMEDGGTFNAGSSNVVFAGDTAIGVVRISGETDFYDITITDSTTLRPGVDAYIGLEGSLTNNGILDAASNHNTIEYKKDASFAIPNPNGTNGGYHSLIISGTGTKTLPSEPLYIWHDFINNGTVAAGTGSVIFNGLHSAQTIGGSSSTSFYDLTIANTEWEVITTSNLTVSNNLTVNESATLNPGSANVIGGAGTLTGNGLVKVTGLSAVNSLCDQYTITSKILAGLTTDYCGAGDQIICAENYGDLVVSSNGSRNVTLASFGIIAVSGALEFDQSTTSYTNTGSTLEANGSGAQTVPAFNYYNVTVSGDRGGATVSLANGGTIGIAGDGVVSATNVTYDITNSTIDINGDGDQQLDKFSFYYLKISNSGVKTAVDTLTVYAGITIDEGLTLDMASEPLMGPMGTISNNGILKTANTDAAPIPSGKTWDGNVEYSGATAQAVAMGTYQNLTMSGAGGGTINGDVTVNGILNLSHANPQSTKGILHTANDTLIMEASATTIGVGDVTGIIKRQHPFTDSVEYSFGNEFTSLNFRGVPGGVKPTWVACKVEIGLAPTWRSEAINRYYSFAQSGGNDRMIVKLHYLDSELHGSETDESELVFWDSYNPDLVTPNDFTHYFPRNHNATNGVDNWIQLTGPAIDYLATSSTLDVKQWGLAYTNVDTISWIGLGSPSYPGDWSLPGHWNGGVPGSDDHVLIDALPEGSSGYPYRNLLPIIAPSKVNTLKIGTEGTLTVNDFDITISGDDNAWLNNGTFNPGTSAVIFDNGNTSNTMTIGGETGFYDIVISDDTKVQAATNSVLQIGGSLSAGSGSILDFSTNTNTVKYVGNDDQSVLNPTGGIAAGYHHLTLNSNGTKTLPSTLNVRGDLSINSEITYAGNTTILSGTTSQSINGSYPTTFNNVTVDNAAGVTLALDELITVRGALTINTGKVLEVAAGKQLNVSGTIANNAGVSGLVLKSSESGTASLLHETDGVAATVERYISGAAEDWHFLSSPIADETISSDWTPAGTYGNGTGYDMYLWNEASNCWIYQLDEDWNTSVYNGGGEFVVGRGYLYSVEVETPTKEFSGNLNNSTQTVALTTSSLVDSVKGFNLIGNPYPSSIDWMATSGWSRDLLATSGSTQGHNMWIWNPAAGNYGVFNSATGDGTNSVTRYIAPMQGFFVRTESAGNLEMTNDVRVLDATTVWKSATMNPYRIKAVVSSVLDETSDEVHLVFGHQKDEGGATKLFSPLTSAPSLFLPLEDMSYSIRYMGDDDSVSSVPLKFKAGASGKYTLNFDFSTYDFDTVLLKDHLTNEITDLTLVSNYSFNATTSDNANRFTIYFKGIEEELEEDFSARAYTINNDLIIDLLLEKEETNIMVYDVLGRKLLNERLKGENKYKFSIATNSRVLLVYIENKNGKSSTKVILNKP